MERTPKLYILAAMRHQPRAHLVAILALSVACSGAQSTPDPVEAEREDSPPAGIRTPPGAEPYNDDLKERISKALAVRGTDYRPRTEHLRPDGSAIYTNRLIFETSPYLEQHAHNPVDWYPWGDEAFRRAQELGRPVFLSVGYSTCHWCHVMERESFEDEEIARFMNQHFIAIKVDREERPDVDSVYMTAVYAMAGSGGWPMTVVMTHDRKPFFAGTYFPPRTGARGGQKGLWEILHEIADRYAEHREDLETMAARIGQRVAQSLSADRPGDLPGPGAIVNGARSLAAGYDSVNGGFGSGRKFPRPVTLALLLRYHRRTGDREALAMVEQTLERMARGGIHDQIGGGFHRYTVEPTWLIPHFEKMLYDNAQLAVIYLEASQATGREDFAGVARRILDYVAAEMTAPEGGFYSATDADSRAPSGHDEEGWFFTWTPDEILRVVGGKLAPEVIAFYGVTEAGNFEDRNVLHAPRPIEAVAASLEMKPDQLAEDLEKARALLYRARLRRPPPLTDTKILTAWNGLMVSAFARGAQVLDEPGYGTLAAGAADFLLRECQKDGRLYRTYASGRAAHPGVLSDYAFLAAGLLDLYETTHEPRWLEEAIGLHRTLEARFWDSAGGYFMTADDAEQLLGREKPTYDGAEPAGNSVALLNLLRLYELTEGERYRRMAERGFAAFSQALEHSSSAVPLMLCALDYYLDKPKEVVLVSRRDPAEAAPFLAKLAGRFLPNRVLVVAAENDHLAGTAKLIPLLEDRVALQGKPTAYVCQGRVCKLPTTDPEEFDHQLEEVAPYDGVPPPSMDQRR